jgi:nucleoside-diphosphate-sugar epimerase
LCAEKYNFYNIRIFNCFGPGEPETRIFPRYLNKSATFEINNDREFDYFSIQDLCTVVRHCAEHDWLVKDVNAVYTEKYKISEVLNMFCTANGLEPDFIVASTSSNNYTGSGEKLQSLGIKLNGLYDGLSTYIKKEENDSI